ncbi:4-hydroxy-tetrahydrodipicolinate reductase [Streptomyces sp. NPDC057271]|uniref:4-hydroxy-tetrahydrodipicolinate reductase n=1 Tax=unclassified Streptomyces TaxID=2593676 RepID=UPI00363865DD
MTIATVVCGRSGRMANLIAAAVDRSEDLDLTARLSVRDGAGAPPGAEPVPLVRKLAELPDPRPVVVDFTSHEATADVLRQAVDAPCPLVVGTSGLGAAERALITEVGRTGAVVVAANFSLALLAVARFVRELSQQVDNTWDAGVMDLHFAGKRDRPSATARFLADQWRSETPGRTGRGPADARSGAPELASFRMGDAVSEHRLMAAGTGEHVEVLHRVADRAAFLPGILRAVRFAAHARPGVYSLEDVACSTAAAPE